METIYKVECGVLLEKDNTDYNCYNNVYDKKNAYYDENVRFSLDLEKAKRVGTDYVNEGVNGTYAIVSKLEYCKEDFGEDFDKYLEEDFNNNIDEFFMWGVDYIDYFGSDLYSQENIVYSLWKIRNKEYTYPNKNGKLIENFVGKDMLESEEE